MKTSKPLRDAGFKCTAVSEGEEQSDDKNKDLKRELSGPDVPLIDLKFMKSFAW